MAVRSFKGDIQIGDYFEEVMRKYLSCEHDILKTEGNFREYDLICLDCYKRFECKYDLILATTGNFCFEVPTLVHTEAEQIIYGYRNKGLEMANTAYIFDTDRLKDWLFNNPDNFVTKQGGDFNYDLFLVPNIYWEEIGGRKITVEAHYEL